MRAHLEAVRVALTLCCIVELTDVSYRRELSTLRASGTLRHDVQHMVPGHHYTVLYTFPSLQMNYVCYKLEYAFILSVN